MEQLPEKPTTPDSESTPTSAPNVVHFSVEPKSWLGKLLAGIIGGALLLVVLLFSIVAFAVIAGIGLAAVIYLAWKTRHVRRELQKRMSEEAARRRTDQAPRGQTIDVEPESRD